MTAPIVTELPLVLQPVLRNTFVYPVVRDGDPRPGAATQPQVRRIFD